VWGVLGLNIPPPPIVSRSVYGIFFFFFCIIFFVRIAYFLPFLCTTSTFLAQFWAVSDPFGPEYKKYLSLEDIGNLLHPPLSEEERAKGEVPSNEFVMTWLASQPNLLAGAPATTKIRDVVTATLNAQAAEEVFGTELFHFSPATAGPRNLDMVRAASPYSLPDELAAKVSLVDKLLRLPAMTPAKVAAAEEGMRNREDEDEGAKKGASDDSDPFDSCTPTACHGSTNPAVLKERYGFTTKTNYTQGNSMACTEFQLQVWHLSDIP